MLVIKPLWVAHVPQDATIYSGELRSKADVRSYTKKNPNIKIFGHKNAFLPQFCCIFRTLVLPFHFFYTPIRPVCLDAGSPFPHGVFTHLEK